MELEKKMTETDDNEIKLYYKLKIIEIQEEISAKEENNFKEEIFMILLLPFILLFVVFFLATDKLLEYIDELFYAIQEEKSQTIKS